LKIELQQLKQNTKTAIYQTQLLVDNTSQTAAYDDWMHKTLSSPVHVL